MEHKISLWYLEQTVSESYSELVQSHLYLQYT